MLRKLTRKLTRNHFLRDECGANAVEFAMVVLPMAVMTIAIIEVGSLFFAYNDLHNAAREGARRLAVQDLIVFGDGAAGDFGAWETDSQFTCDSSGTQPGANTVESIVCANLAGWDDRVTVTTAGFAAVPPSQNCNEVGVRIETTMANAALFNVFNALDGLTMRVEARMISEYDLAAGGNTCS